ncbi:uncharacterized protein LY89DRAFT_662953 [Mollisia scopiformis]|uniref:SAP domain-containing protein n=1 Tax=Mollisia scopiformis TaxID=149040 RepID=A0A194XWT0_MOLSC|nr:uncharacterized protein LY89DRAFT_662953 [Mollisia scopiformis]KUJ24197.1 hypothetical protein LY89DRAFT_662953 [Mollisia scopiformis]
MVDAWDHGRVLNLQAQCRAQNLPIDGTRAQLSKRLREHQRENKVGTDIQTPSIVHPAVAQVNARVHMLLEREKERNRMRKAKHPLQPAAELPVNSQAITMPDIPAALPTVLKTDNSDLFVRLHMLIQSDKQPSGTRLSQAANVMANSQAIAMPDYISFEDSDVDDSGPNSTRFAYLAAEEDESTEEGIELSCRRNYTSLDSIKQMREDKQAMVKGYDNKLKELDQQEVAKHIEVQKALKQNGRSVTNAAHREATAEHKMQKAKVENERKENLAAFKRDNVVWKKSQAWKVEFPKLKAMREARGLETIISDFAPCLGFSNPSRAISGIRSAKSRTPGNGKYAAGYAVGNVDDETSSTLSIPRSKSGISGSSTIDHAIQGESNARRSSILRSASGDKSTLIDISVEVVASSMRGLNKPATSTSGDNCSDKSIPVDMPIKVTTSSKRKAEEGVESISSASKRRRIDEPGEYRAWRSEGISRGDLRFKLADRTYIWIPEYSIPMSNDNLIVVKKMVEFWVAEENVQADEKTGGYFIVFADSNDGIRYARKCFDLFKSFRFGSNLIPAILSSKDVNIDEFNGRVDDCVANDLLAATHAYLRKGR